jgi:hypothetical protein
MAYTSYENPLQYDGPPMRLVKLAAADSQTWQAGQFVRTTDSGVVLCLTAATSISGITAKSQAVATSTSTVDIYTIPSAASRFVIGVATGGADGKAGLSLIGTSGGLEVNSSVCYFASANDTQEVMKCHDVMGRVEPQQNDTSDTSGRAVVSVYASALDADA